MAWTGGAPAALLPERQRRPQQRGNPERV